MRKTAEAVKDNTVLLSLHDVTPFYEDDVIESYDRLQDIGISSFTLLVTPFYQMKRSNSFEKHTIFADYVQSLGLEISLHGYSHFTKSGYSHFTKSGTMDEFQRLPQERVLSRIRLGASLISKSLGEPPFGFVPPLWKAPHRVSGAVSEIGLEYCAYGNSIHLSKDSRILSTVGHIASQGASKIPVANSMVEIELGGPLQIGVHPLDHQNGKIYDLIIDMKDRLGYTFLGYRDYISKL
ncbi:MAG: DUF2334 domain-containing protein [Candidatus Thorarchaeota archaeon]